MARYSLLYFDLPGRGEVIRMMFKHTGVQFEDKRIAFAEWPAIKENGVDAPFGFLPVLTTPSGTKISQTLAIIQYVAEEIGLHGNNSDERGVIDNILVSINALFDQAADIGVFTKDEAEKEKKRPKHENEIHHFFQCFEKIRENNPESNFFVGKSITAADIYFVSVVVAIMGSMPGKAYLESYPKLKKLVSDVKESENLKSYLAGDK